MWQTMKKGEILKGKLHSRAENYKNCTSCHQNETKIRTTQKDDACSPNVSMGVILPQSEQMHVSPKV